MPNCPVCKTALNKVSYPSGSLLNRDQWMSCRAGDWYCPSCPDNKRGNSGYHYFWNTELPELSQCEFCKVYEGERHESFCTPNYRQARQFEIQIAALQEQLAVARELVIQLTQGRYDATPETQKLLKAFFDNANTGLVAVKVEDLDWIKKVLCLVALDEKYYKAEGFIERFNRLKAALQAAQKEKGE